MNTGSKLLIVRKSQRHGTVCLDRKDGIFDAGELHNRACAFDHTVQVSLNQHIVRVHKRLAFNAVNNKQVGA